LTPEPKARARCGSSARRDLRGGPAARPVPTATWTVLVKFVRATRGFWEGSSGRAEVEGEALQYFEVAGVGGIPESQSQPGSAGRGQVLDRRLRGGSGE